MHIPWIFQTPTCRFPTLSITHFVYYYSLCQFQFGQFPFGQCWQGGNWRSETLTKWELTNWNWRSGNWRYGSWPYGNQPAIRAGDVLGMGMRLGFGYKAAGYYTGDLKSSKPVMSSMIPFMEACVSLLSARVFKTSWATRRFRPDSGGVTPPHTQSGPLGWNSMISCEPSTWSSEEGVGLSRCFRYRWDLHNIVVA